VIPGTSGKFTLTHTRGFTHYKLLQKLQNFRTAKVHLGKISGFWPVFATLEPIPLGCGATHVHGNRGSVFPPSKAIIKGIGRGATVRDEDQFPTVRFHKCRACGHVYTGSLTGDNACPACHVPAHKDPPTDSRIKHDVEGSHALFTITGNIYKIQELEELRSQIQEVVSKEVDSIAFAFEKASFLSSSTINLLVKTMQTLSIRGKPTFIITDEEDVLESLQMMDLDRVMRILPNLEKYKAALA
jgi:anti-anti-sigma factor